MTTTVFTAPFPSRPAPKIEVKDGSPNAFTISAGDSGMIGQATITSKGAEGMLTAWLGVELPVGTPGGALDVRAAVGWTAWVSVASTLGYSAHTVGSVGIRIRSTDSSGRGTKDEAQQTSKIWDAGVHGFDHDGPGGFTGPPNVEGQTDTLACSCGIIEGRQYFAEVFLNITARASGTDLSGGSLLAVLAGMDAKSITVEVPTQALEVARMGSGPHRGAIGSGIAAVSRARGRLDVFSPRLPGAIVHTWYGEGTPFNRWERLSGSRIGKSVAAASWGSDRLDVFSVTPNGLLVHGWYSDDAGWYAWDVLARALTPSGAVAAVSTRKGRLDVLVSGPLDAPLHIRFDDGAWTDPVPIANDLHQGVVHAAAMAKISATRFAMVTAWGPFLTFATHGDADGWGGNESINVVYDWPPMWGASPVQAAIVAVRRPIVAAKSKETNDYHLFYLGRQQPDAEPQIVHAIRRGLGKWEVSALSPSRDYVGVTATTWGDRRIDVMATVRTPLSGVGTIEHHWTDGDDWRHEDLHS